MSLIRVIGSLNMDFVVQTDKLPLRGETIRGHDFRMIPGGKGANQALAVARLGGQAQMIGRVGEDTFGQQLKDSLSNGGVDTTRVRSTPGIATGVALILVESSGQNQITVAAGANEQLVPIDVEHDFGPSKGGYLLLQLESPVQTVEAALSLARERGVTTILDPAPATRLPSALLHKVDVLTPNESEALLLLGQPPGEVRLEEAPALGQDLRKLGPGTVILKLGDKGAWLVNRSQSRHFPAYPVQAVDVTAAGDTFNGALAVSLAEGRSLDQGLRFANAAAALSATQPGAQASIPSRSEVDSFLS